MNPREINPFASPDATIGPEQVSALPATIRPVKLQLVNVARRAWAIYYERFVPLWIGLLLAMAVLLPLALLHKMLFSELFLETMFRLAGRRALEWILIRRDVLKTALLITSSWISWGLLRYAILVARKEPVPLWVIVYPGFLRSVKLLMHVVLLYFAFLIGVLVILGFALLVGGLEPESMSMNITALCGMGYFLVLFFSLWIVVPLTAHRNLGVWQSLTTSWRLCAGNRWRIFLVFVCGWLLSIAYWIGGGFAIDVLLPNEWENACVNYGLPYFLTIHVSFALPILVALYLELSAPLEVMDRADPPPGPGLEPG